MKEPTLVVPLIVPASGRRAQFFNVPHEKIGVNAKEISIARLLLRRCGVQCERQAEPMKIMIVDDSSSMRLIIKRTLKQAGFSGLKYCEAGDGAEALDSIEQESPDLVLCDWNMPIMSGIEFLSKLREQGNPVKFGFITTESTAAMRAKASEAGAQFLIAKPFTAESFEKTLKRVIV